MTGQTDIKIETEAAAIAEPRCVVVVDESLPAGLAANAAAVLALTLGASVTDLPGPALIDADGISHPGLIPHGLTVLRAPVEALGDLRLRAAREGLVVIDFPKDGQRTNDYEEFRDRVASIPTDRLRYLAVLIFGGRREVRRLTGNLPLLR